MQSYVPIYSRQKRSQLWIELWFLNTICHPNTTLRGKKKMKRHSLFITVKCSAIYDFWEITRICIMDKGKHFFIFLFSKFTYIAFFMQLKLCHKKFTSKRRAVCAFIQSTSDSLLNNLEFFVPCIWSYPHFLMHTSMHCRQMTRTDQNSCRLFYTACWHIPLSLTSAWICQSWPNL